MLDVVITAYAPLGANAFPGRGTPLNVLDDPLIKDLAKKYERTPG